METVPQCDCHSAYQLSRSLAHQWNNLTAVFDGLDCLVQQVEEEEEGSGSISRQWRTKLDDPEILQILNCEGAVIEVPVLGFSLP